jgi:hypothetical protein
MEKLKEPLGNTYLRVRRCLRGGSVAANGPLHRGPEALVHPDHLVPAPAAASVDVDVSDPGGQLTVTQLVVQAR